MTCKRQKMEELDEDVFECDFCHQRYNHFSRRAKLLACHHSYCLKCLQSLQSSDKIIICPACQYKTEVGPTGVVSLADNTFVLERLKIEPEEDVILTSDEDLDSHLDMGDSDTPLTNGSSSTQNSAIKRPSARKPELFCRSCNKAAQPSCAGFHELCKYDVKVKELEDELVMQQRSVVSQAEKAIQCSEQLATLTVAMEDAWEALKINLKHMQKEYNEQLRTISDLKVAIESTSGQQGKWGVDEARGGNPAVLQESILRLNEHGENLDYKARVFDDTIAQWKVFTNCTAQIKLQDKNPAFPLGNFSINLDLHEQNNSPECLCMMYSIYKYVENRLQTKRMDSMLGDVNAFGSNTVKDISVNSSAAAESKEHNNNENSFHLEVVDTKPKATIAQIVATKAAAPPAPKVVPKAAPMSKPLTPAKYPNSVFCYFDLSHNNEDIGRVIMEVYFSKAPIMARNFIELCTGVHGITYKYTDLWQVPDNDHVVGGHIREGDNDKVSIYDRKAFRGDSSPLHDGVGMLRMRGHGTAANGEAIVGSQFMIWMKQKLFKNYARTLVFGKVVAGMDVLHKVPAMVNKKDGQPVKRIVPCRIMDSGICAAP